MLSRLASFVKPSRLGAQAVVGERFVRAYGGRAAERVNRREVDGNQGADRRRSDDGQRIERPNWRPNAGGDREARVPSTTIVVALPDAIKDSLARAQAEMMKHCGELAMFKVPRARIGFVLPSVAHEDAERNLRDAMNSFRKFKVELKLTMEALPPVVGVPIENSEEVNQKLAVIYDALKQEPATISRLALFREKERLSAINGEHNRLRHERWLKMRDDASDAELERLSEKYEELRTIRLYSKDKVRDLFSAAAAAVDVRNYLKTTSITVDKVVLFQGYRRVELSLG